MIIKTKTKVEDTMLYKNFLICFIMLLLLCGFSAASDSYNAIHSTNDSICKVNVDSLITNSTVVIEIEDIADNSQAIITNYQIISNSRRKVKTVRNEYFRENEKYNMDEIKSAVKEMLNEDINPQAHDFVSLFNTEKFPEVNHEILKIPGKFKILSSARGFTSKGRHKYMDAIEIIDPDGKDVIYKSIANIEFIISNMSDETLYDYDLACITKFKKRAFHIHVVNKDPGISEEVKIISGHPIRILYRVFDEKRQWKVLNKLITKNSNNEEITLNEYMEWAHCIANTTNPNAKKYIEMDTDYRLNLHLSLRVMIKLVFKDDKKKTEELLTMITKAIPHDYVSEARSYEDTVRQLNTIKKVNEDTVRQIITLQKEKEDTVRQNIILIKENEEQRKEILAKDSTIKDKDSEIDRLKDEIQFLKKSK